MSRVKNKGTGRKAPPQPPRKSGSVGADIVRRMIAQYEANYKEEKK